MCFLFLRSEVLILFLDYVDVFNISEKGIVLDFFKFEDWRNLIKDALR